MEPFTIAAIASIASTIINGIVSGVGTNKTNQISQGISNQNIGFQQAENELTRSREDNAIWRSSQDMIHAGLSKTLAAGQPASATALSAPQSNYTYQSPAMKAMEHMQLKETFMNLQSLKADVDYKKAQGELLKAQTVGQLLSNDTYMENFYNEQSQKLGNIELMKAQVARYDAETALTNSLAPYQVEKVKADIDKVLADIDLTKIQGEHIKAQTDYTNIQTEIAKIDKSYRPAYWSNEFKFKDAQIDKMKAEIDKIAQDKAESIARENKLNKEQELLVQEVLNAELSGDIMRQNLNYATNHNLPVGATPSGFIGGLVNTGVSYGSALAGMFTGNYQLPLGWN